MNPLKKYQEWLEILGYTEIKESPKKIGNFYHYLAKHSPTTLEPNHIKEYLHHFSITPKANGQARSIAYTKKELSNLRLYNKYLKATKQKLLPLQDITVEEIESPQETRIITQAQIKELFTATKDNLEGERNRAILSLYYGLGLRKSEGYRLNLSDLDYHQNLVTIHKSKNGYSRQVPLTKPVKKHLLEYIHHARHLQAKQGEQALLISSRGTRLAKESIVYNFKKLQNQTRLKHNKIGLHSLRHSIASHLLSKGLKLQQIATFLGHRSLESTQHYTHIHTEQEENEPLQNLFAK
jgi:integrase/recombinase XerD